VTVVDVFVVAAPGSGTRPAGPRLNFLGLTLVVTKA
jgi:hypothetical protein